LLAPTRFLQYTLNTMNKHIQEKLLKINRTFYDQFAPSFSATRGRVQPGVRKLIGNISAESSILDVGCGNGSLARALAEGGFSGRYLGVDMSEGLLASAESLLDEGTQGSFNFKAVDLSDPDWPKAIPHATFDWLVSFAVLHHLPGESLRHQIVSAFTNMVNPNSRVAVSVWQWQNSPRLRKRVLPWSTVGLSSDQVGGGDVLLDWRAGDTPGLRYVHTFEEADLAALAESAGFRVIQTFYSDGKSGDLALYQVWQLYQA